MKSILGGFTVAVLLALAAWAFLDREVQENALQTYTVPSARP